jgi:hypothetical protein
MARHEITLDDGGANEVTLEVLPFEWPRSVFELLQVQASEVTGWRYATGAVVVKLKALYGGAHGQVLRGLGGPIVQYAETTGGAAFTVTDWRGNTGTFAFVPVDGLTIEEIHGSADEGDPTGSAFHRLTLRLVKLS